MPLGRVKNGEREISLKELKGKLNFAGGDVSTLEPGLSAKVVGGDFHLSGEGKVLGDPKNRSANFTMSGKAFPWHGVAFDHLKANVIYSAQDRSVAVKSFDMTYRGKAVTGEFRYSMPTKILEIAGLESQVDFLELAKDYSGKNAEENGQGLVLVTAPHLGVIGRVEFGSLEKSDLKIEFLNDAGAVVKTAGRQISMKELKGTLTFSGGSVSTLEPGLTTQIAGGSVFLSGKVGVLDENKAYQATLKLEDVSLDELKSLVSANEEGKVRGEGEQAANKEEVKEVREGAKKRSKEAIQKEAMEDGKKGDKSKKETVKSDEAKDEKKSTEQQLAGRKTALQGRLFFEFAGSGDAGMPLRQGKGLLRIDEAQFYTMPMFGSFFDTINKVIPAFGRRKDGETHGTQKLTGTYQIEDAKIRSEDLRIRGNLSQIEVKAFYDVVKDSADIDGKIEFTGAVGVVTSLASNLLEIEGTGPLKDLKWKLKNINATGVVKVGAKGVTDASKGVLKLGGDTAKGAVKITGKITGKSVEGIGKGLKKVLPFKKKKVDPNP